MDSILWHSLVCRWIIPISTSFLHRVFPSLYVCLSSLLLRNQFGLRIHSTSVCPHLKELLLPYPHFQIRSHPEVPDGHEFGGGHYSTHYSDHLGTVNDSATMSRVPMFTDFFAHRGTMTTVNPLVISWFINSAGIQKSTSVILWTGVKTFVKTSKTIFLKCFT